MLDKTTQIITRTPLLWIAKYLKKTRISANFITLLGLFFGILAFIAIIYKLYYIGILFILLNRLCDGLDGALSQLTKATDFGGFLDINCDFIFYNGIVLAFILASPTTNAISGAVLMFSFVGTGTSFLSFAIIAAKRNIKINKSSLNKSFYYLDGITTSTETVFLFLLFCLLPQYFSIFAYIFAFLCFLTTIMRVLVAKRTFFD